MFAKTIRITATLGLVIGAALVTTGSAEALTAGAQERVAVSAAAEPQATDGTTTLSDDMGWQ